QHKRWLDVYKETAQRWGNKTHVILWRDGWVTRTETEKETAKKLWWPCIRGDRWFYFSSFPQRAWGGELPQWLKAIKSEEDFTPEHIEPELVTGTVDEVIEEIAKYKRELECDYFIFRCIFGRGPSLEPVVECLKLFASEVMPHFKD
ncbi:MAG: hypothetical protein ACE5PO_07425, partial [Candidatus Bathyarchaeia archaeon]